MNAIIHHLWLITDHCFFTIDQRFLHNCDMLTLISELYYSAWIPINGGMSAVNWWSASVWLALPLWQFNLGKQKKICTWERNRKGKRKTMNSKKLQAGEGYEQHLWRQQWAASSRAPLPTHSLLASSGGENEINLGDDLRPRAKVTN